MGAAGFFLPFNLLFFLYKQPFPGLFLTLAAVDRKLPKGKAYYLHKKHGCRLSKMGCWFSS
jgi:hypothetical protein